MEIFRMVLNHIGFKSNCIKSENTSSNIKIAFPEVLRKNIEANAENNHLTTEAYIIKILENNTIPSEYIKPEMSSKACQH